MNKLCIFIIDFFLIIKYMSKNKFTKEELIAIDKFQSGEKYGVSEFIDEDTIIAGYGNLNTDFEFPLPVVYIKQIYGTTSWGEYKLLNKK
jgi:hypothetical protein